MKTFKEWVIFNRESFIDINDYALKVNVYMDYNKKSKAPTIPYFCLTNSNMNIVSSIVVNFLIELIGNYYVYRVYLENNCTIIDVVYPRSVNKEVIE